MSQLHQPCTVLKGRQWYSLQLHYLFYFSSLRFLVDNLWKRNSLCFYVESVYSNVSSTTNYAQYSRNVSVISYTCIICYSSLFRLYCTVAKSLVASTSRQMGNSMIGTRSLVPLKAGVTVFHPHFIHKVLYLLHSFSSLYCWLIKHLWPRLLGKCETRW